MWKTIKEIGNKNEVIIRPADKGGGLVILNKADYEEEMENLLRVENTYKKLKGNPKARYIKKLIKYVKKGATMGILNKKEAEYLVSNSTKTPVIFYAPKIHKRLEKPPGRPIISGINSIFSRLGEYLDTYLQPIVKEGRSHLRDSLQLMNYSISTVRKTGFWPLLTSTRCIPAYPRKPLPLG